MKVTYGAIVQRASGRFGGTVHSNWKGVDVVRRFAKPSNPATVSQEATRFAFRNLTQAFLLQPSQVRAAWDSFVTGKPLINRNAFIGKNVVPIVANDDAQDMVVTPGDSSALAPVSIVPTGGVGQITTVITAPAVPTGWSITNAVAYAILTGVGWTTDALTAAQMLQGAAVDPSSPYTGATITPLTAGDYYVFAFLQWLAPDGTTRYSASVSGGAPVTVT